VGALVVQEEDEVLVVMGGGKVVRSSVAGVPAKGRDTMGVIFAKPDKNDRIIEVARNTERGLEEEVEASAERESEADHTDEPSASEILAIAADDVTLAEDAGPDEESAEEASGLADEAEGTSGDAEANEDNTGGNE
jgi:DNA gyrase subunit A